MYVCVPHATNAVVVQGALDSLGLELWVVMSCHVGPGDGIFAKVGSVRVTAEPFPSPSAFN